MQGKPVVPLTLAGVAALVLVAITLVSVWSLAHPQRDPVGNALAAMGARLDGVRSWYAQGPVEASPDWQAMRLNVPGGDAARGRLAMVEYGCGACHVIPGVASARGTVGPSLDGLARRAYIAGVLTNAPGDLTRWLMNPPLFSPETAMPNLGVTEADAADMAAYLYTLGPDA